MFPPPMTITTCTPSSRTSWICRAMSRTASGSMPTPRSPPRASPLSLRRIRWYLARFVMGVAVLHAGPGSVKRLVSLRRRPHSAGAILVRAVEAMTEPAITPQLVQQHNLTPEEFARIQAILGRDPSYTELGIFSVMWSEHCSYKNTRPLLKTFPTKSPRILVGAGEENAGILDIGEGLAIAFKIESHNHPSAVEPFQGAATGVGGIIRDIFTMGARPVAALNSLRFGELSNPEVRRLFSGVVSGIAH